jgi:hypothetical protein
VIGLGLGKNRVDEVKTLHDVIKTLESWILDPQVRSSVDLMEDILAEDFIEFGHSGRVYERTEIIEILSTMPLGVVEMDDFQMRELGQDHVLTIYRAVRSEQKGAETGVSNRCSIW